MSLNGPSTPIFTTMQMNQKLYSKINKTKQNYNKQITNNKKQEYDNEPVVLFGMENRNSLC